MTMMACPNTEPFLCFVIASASVFGCLFQWGGGISVERKLSESLNGFLRARLSHAHPEPAETHVDPTAAFCSPIFPLADLVFLFS
jgi:hypothetical protein